jgi:hypothetical protein
MKRPDREICPKIPWHTPELIVLARTTPEEMALNACKAPGGGVSSPGKSNCGNKSPCNLISHS